MAYTTFGRGFTAQAYYRGASAGAFNALDDESGCFAAYCTFLLNPAIQNPGGVPVREYLWGNSEDAAFSGWSLELVVVGGELSLQAKVGNGTNYTAAVQEPLTGPLVVATGQIPAAGIFGRLIMATMWLDGTNLVLAINGTICNWVAFNKATLAPSALSASLGAGTAATAAVPATYADIVSCGYSSDAGIALGTPSLAAGLMGSAFGEAQEGNGSGFINSSGLDWTHRYAFSAVASNLPGTISKTATGALPTSFPAAPALTDLGGAGPGNLGAYAPVTLNRGGNLTTQPILYQRKNFDWANAGTFFYTP